MNTQIQHERTEFSAALADAVRERRRMLSMTQEDLAAASGVSVRFVGQVEAAKPTVQLDHLLRVLTTLGFSLALANQNR